MNRPKFTATEAIGIVKEARALARRRQFTKEAAHVIKVARHLNRQARTPMEKAAVGNYIKQLLSRVGAGTATAAGNVAERVGAKGTGEALRGYGSRLGETGKMSRKQIGEHAGTITAGAGEGAKQKAMAGAKAKAKTQASQGGAMGAGAKPPSASIGEAAQRGAQQEAQGAVSQQMLRDRLMSRLIGGGTLASGAGAVGLGASALGGEAPMSPEQKQRMMMAAKGPLGLIPGM